MPGRVAATFTETLREHRRCVVEPRILDCPFERGVLVLAVHARDADALRDEPCAKFEMREVCADEQHAAPRRMRGFEMLEAFDRERNACDRGA